MTKNRRPGWAQEILCILPILCFAGLALVAAPTVGCGDDTTCDYPDSGVDAGPDAWVPKECELPNVDCLAGEHAEYSICVPDSDELAVAGGTFEMGAPTGTEFPLHSVTLGSYSIDRYEVTTEKYLSCVQAGCCEPPTYNGSYTGREPYYGNPEYYDYPMIFVTWEMAAQFCEGMGKRLPTEAEWEFAARGDDGRTYPWGSEPPSSTTANFGGAQDGDTEAVGSYVDGASPYGAEDMAGNVWEWVADLYGADYYNYSPEDNPTGPATGLTRVARGGSFASDPTTLASYYRMHYLPGESFATLGFRCAR